MQDAIILGMLLGGAMAAAMLALGVAHVLRADRLLANLRSGEVALSLLGLGGLVGAFVLLTGSARAFSDTGGVLGILLCLACVASALRPGATRSRTGVVRATTTQTPVSRAA
jgi:hypothetical protein